jgi:hypothetical protein
MINTKHVKPGEKLMHNGGNWYVVQSSADSCGMFTARQDKGEIATPSRRMNIKDFSQYVAWLLDLEVSRLQKQMDEMNARLAKLEAANRYQGDYKPMGYTSESYVIVPLPEMPYAAEAEMKREAGNLVAELAGEGHRIREDADGTSYYVLDAKIAGVTRLINYYLNDSEGAVVEQIRGLVRVK